MVRGFVNGHITWNKGLTKESDVRVLKNAIAISNAVKKEKNHMWKGDKVGYGALHSWVKRQKPKPKYCECCKKNFVYDLANISGEYKRDINDYEWLCRKCHMKKDGRNIKVLSNLKQFREKR